VRRKKLGLPIIDLNNMPSAKEIAAAWKRATAEHRLLRAKKVAEIAKFLWRRKIKLVGTLGVLGWAFTLDGIAKASDSVEMNKLMEMYGGILDGQLNGRPPTTDDFGKMADQIYKVLKVAGLERYWGGRPRVLFEGWPDFELNNEFTCDD
jgi:hypothetical protein